MRLVNLTPMPIALCDRRGRVRWYEPDGRVPRIVPRESVPLDLDESHDVQVFMRVAVEGLPTPCPDGFRHPDGAIVFLVDPLIAHLCAEVRWDLVSVDPTSTVGPGATTGIVYYRRLISWDLSDRVRLVETQMQEA